MNALISGDPELARLAQTARDTPQGWALPNLKAALIAKLGVPHAHKALTSQLSAVTPGSGPLRRMIDMATDRQELSPAGPMLLPGVQLPGGQRSPATTITARAQFLACFDDATTFGRSALISHRGAVFSDHQGDEINRVPTRAWFDPLLSGRDGDTYYWHLPSSPALTLPEAIDLTGAFSPGWGHAILEFAPQLLLAQHLHSFAADVPLLVDDGLAEQHYALFHWLSGGRKIIKLGFRQGAQVARLWRASAPDFWPILRQPGTVLKLKDTAVNPAIQAQLLANVPPVPADETQPKRLFIRRSGHARLADQDGMAELLAKAGFAAITPETLSLKQQLILFAGASHIAGAGGSQLLLPMMFGNPALKVLNFHNPDLEETPAIVAVAEARGQTVLVVPGEITAPNPDLPYNADFTITEPQLAAALASLGANQ